MCPPKRVTGQNLVLHKALMLTLIARITGFTKPDACFIFSNNNHSCVNYVIDIAICGSDNSVEFTWDL